MNFRFKLSRRLAGMKLAVVIAGTLALGCGIGSSGPVISRIDGIQITPGRIALQPFQAANLTIVVLTSRGIDSTGAAAALQLSATGGSIVSNGVLGGVYYITYTSPPQPGNYVLTVTTVNGSPTATASIGVTSNPVPVNQVAVTPATATLAVNDTTRLKASLTDSTGASLFGRPISWSSSDGNIALVVEGGFVRAFAPGTVTITATSETHSGSATITVKPGP